jgi:hypothetical protein
VASVFWDGQFDKLNWTGNLGTTLHGKSDDGSKEGSQLYLNNRLGFRVSQLAEPYLGVDYEKQNGSGGAAANHETTAAFGVMFYALDKGHIAVHYQKGLSGENRAVSNNLNLRFAYVF